jgi:hypothetical protein
MKAAAALISAWVLAGPALAQTAPAAPAPAPVAAPAAPVSCDPIRGISFICGMTNVEDLFPVDGGKSILASSYKEGSVGFYLIDTATKKARPVALTVGTPDPIYGCPGAPDLTKLSTHGLDVRQGRNGTGVVYAINHGGRESVEVFNLDARAGTAQWVGCVVAPDGTSANSVVGLPDKSIVFTKLFDTKAANTGIGPVLKGEITGTVYRWTPGKGISEVPGTQLSGDNGLIASPDGKTLYVNAYGTWEVYKVPLDGKTKPTSVKVEFNPDNLRWAPDGNIYVVGQFLHPENLAGPNDWGVARLDPKTMHVRTVLTAPGMKEFDNATVGVVVGPTLYLGTFKGDRVAYMNAP